MTPSAPIDSDEPRRISKTMADSGRGGQTQLLVGHDDHQASRAAVRFAAELASRLQAHLHVVHVVDLNDSPIDVDSAHWDDIVEQSLAKQQSDAERLLENTDIDWTYHATYGEPSNLLGEVAARYDVLFIIIGASEHSITRRLIEGSVSHRLLRHQPKPVLVVPAAELPK